jgi:hypothetical protein
VRCIAVASARRCQASRPAARAALVGDHGQRGVEPRDGGDAARPPVPGAAEAARRGHQLVQRRHVDHADHRLAPHLDADERPVQRHAADEGPGAVERVDDPADGGAAPAGTLLLAEDRVIRIRPLDHRPHGALGLAVGARDRRAVGLHLDRRTGVEVGERAGAAGARRVDGDGEEIAQRRLAHGASLCAARRRAGKGRHAHAAPCRGLRAGAVANPG